MSLKTFNTIPACPKIALTDLLIRAYGMRKPVKPVGQATLNIAYCNHHLQVELQIICKYNEPTDWVSALLTAEKPNGQLRVCLDPRPLNKAIKREHFQIPMFDDVIAELHGKRMFTIIDMRDGFWHIKLDDASSKLCTFNTPFGRYSYLRLPFGIYSTPEVFQRKNYELFGDIPNVHIVFDDSEHNTALCELLERARKYTCSSTEQKYSSRYRPFATLDIFCQLTASVRIRPR